MWKRSPSSCPPWRTEGLRFLKRIQALNKIAVNGKIHSESAKYAQHEEATSLWRWRAFPPQHGHRAAPRPRLRFLLQPKASSFLPRIRSLFGKRAEFDHSCGLCGVFTGNLYQVLQLPGGAVVGTVCVEFACSPSACVGFPHAVHFLPTDQNHAR